MSFGQKILVIVLIILMVLGIVYVGSRQNRQEEEIKENAYNQVDTVNFWYSDDRYTDFFTKAAVAFHEKNPDIRVIPVLVGSSEYLEKINEASLSNDSFPDLYMISNDSLEKAYLSGLASEAKNTCNVLNTAHFSQSALDAVTYKKNYVAYPLCFETSVLLYNKTLLDNWVEKFNAGLVEDGGEGVTLDEMQIEEGDEVDTSGLDEKQEVTEEVVVLTLEGLIPENFDKLIEFSQTYQAEEGVEGVLKWDVSDIFYNYLFVGNYMIVGGDSGDDTSNIDIYNDDTLKCVNLYKNLNQVFSIDSKTSSYSKMLEDFLDGKMIFTIATSDCIEKISERMEEGALVKAEAEAKALEEGESGELSADEASSEAASEETTEDGEELPEEYTPKHIQVGEPEKKYFEYGYAAIPDISADLKSRSLSVTDALVINGYSTVKESADKFAAYLSTECAPDLYARTGRLSAAKDAGYSDDASRIFQKEYSESIPLPKIVETSNLWVQLEIAFQDIWNGEDAATRLKKFADQISSQIVTGE